MKESSDLYLKESKFGTFPTVLDYKYLLDLFYPRDRLR